MCASQKSEISYALLSYLITHPDAQDTLEGIVEWWLVAHMIESRTRVVKEALADLTHRQLVIEYQGKDRCTRYGINRGKVDEITTILEQVHNQG